MCLQENENDHYKGDNYQGGNYKSDNDEDDRAIKVLIRLYLQLDL